MGKAILLFLRGLASPVVLYSEQPEVLYEDIKNLIRQANRQAPKLVERPGNGPLQKVTFLDVDLMGCALQGEPPSASVNTSGQS